MKLVCISDTHGMHNHLSMPEGDILIHSGDFSISGHMEDLIKFAKWMSFQPYKHLILVAGNHDAMLSGSLANNARTILEQHGITYLKDSSVTIEGYKFYGSPWTPQFGNWSFMKRRNSSSLQWIWNNIPNDTDILITHGPPFGILDLNHRLQNCGCEQLRKRISELNLKVHIFGHIHHSHGIIFKDYENDQKDVFINASSLGENYISINQPITFDLFKQVEK